VRADYATGHGHFQDSRCLEAGLYCSEHYGPTDPSSAVTALNEFQQMEGLSSAVKEKILSHNAKALYRL
jgi:hypothetical protein